ncbi:cobalt ABC transporter substrate-binding protein CbiN [Thiocapsa imhoffii]|uniref:Cobalt transport protein CbiN n=1 Tax=Thiocapsa imhoffii TaxID=382777 RepID=A0A9X0WJY2_9GAMM|nr:energy-coupling factor ABC transporter substrate-binding protein [Thiocapsa imhoffii]MBK1646111.1 cobalt ABC transporter substrate-binding protein CbiN [Thiocapsa imhoffii]
MTRIDWTLLGFILILVTAPLLLPVGGHLDERFAGADGQAQEAILATHPRYEPWFEPLWEPPSGEIESLLFALQAALGAGVLGYYFGLRRGQTRARSAARAAERAQPSSTRDGTE